MTSAHLDYETLAELAEGLLETDHAASADTHLAECEECRERSTEISEVSRLLAEASVPPMPAELATRIDAAIAAEMPPVSEFAHVRSRWHSRRLQLLSAAAAAVVLVGGGITVTRATLESQQFSPSVADSASRPAAQDPAQRSAEAKADTGTAPSIRVEGMPYPVLSTGIDYRRSTLADQVRATLGRPGTAAASGPRSAGLLGCIDRIGRSKRPVLVDVAGFEGRSATLIVLPGDTPDKLDAWIVGPGCSAGSSDVLGRTRLDR